MSTRPPYPGSVVVGFDGSASALTAAQWAAAEARSRGRALALVHALVPPVTPGGLGVGLPPEVPSWGNIMASGRQYFRIFPHNILFPGLFIAATVLCVNVLGDALRDRLDPTSRKRG